MRDDVVVPEFIRDAIRRFEEGPHVVEIGDAEAELPEQAISTRHRAREFTREQVSPIAARIDRENEIPGSLRRAMVDAGFYGLSIPPEYGGAGSILETCLVVEELSRISASVGLLIAVQHLGSTPLVLAGTDEQKRTWLPRLASGEQFCSFCLTEPDAGTDAAGVRTRVETGPDGIILNGLKQYISGAGLSDLYTVFARSGDERYEMTPVLVPADIAGFTVVGRHPFTGIRGIPVGQLQFENVQLPDEARLGEPGRGFQLALATLDRARPAIAAQALGLAQGAFDAAVSYLANREQFGKPLLDQEVIQHRLARHAAMITSGRLMTYHAARLADQQSPALNAAASMAKLSCTDLAMDVVTDAMQFWGGAGYMTGTPVERMYRDAKIMQIYEGTNEIQEMVIARAVQRRYREGQS